MTTDVTAEQIGLDQRATDPRLEVPASEPVVATPEPVLEPATDEESTEEPVVPAAEIPKPKKTAEEVLKGRVGHLTKTLSAKDEAIAAAIARADAAEALLAASRAPEGQDAPAPVTKPVPGTFTQADFDAAVKAQAEVQEFNRNADAMYNKGAEKFTDWKDAVDTLVVSGFMNKDLIDAAMAVDDGPAVLHHLGTNLDEAERISSLPPIQKAAAMAKLSGTLAAPRTVPVSNAPAPIKPVTGAANPAIDLQRISDEGDMSSYIAARAKQGSRWAVGRR